MGLRRYSSSFEGSVLVRKTSWFRGFEEAAKVEEGRRSWKIVARGDILVDRVGIVGSGVATVGAARVTAMGAGMVSAGVVIARMVSAGVVEAGMFSESGLVLTSVSKAMVKSCLL